MNKEVKKILEDNLVDGVIISAEDLEVYTPILDRMSNQICRLIPKSPDNPDGYEPKPDSGRLLTKADLDRIDLKNAESNFIDALYDTSREQDVKTASILKAEWEAKEKEFLEAIEDARQCGYLSGIDEGRVLKDEERKDKNSVEVAEAYFRGRQDGLMIKEFEYQARVKEIEKIHKEELSFNERFMKEVGQARVERIFNFLRKHIGKRHFGGFELLISDEEWQSLEK